MSKIIEMRPWRNARAFFYFAKGKRSLDRSFVLVYYVINTLIQFEVIVMKAWWVLYKRELRLNSGNKKTQRRLNWMAALLTVLFLSAAYFFRSGHVSTLLLAIMYILFLVPAASMITSLMREKQRLPLWLQLPMPGWKLLAAKYAAVMTEFVSGMGVMFLLFLGAYHLEKSGANWPVDSAEIDPVEHYRMFTSLLRGSEWQSPVMFVLSALLVTAFMVLLYVTAMLLTTRFGRMGWPAAIVLIGAVSGLGLLFESSSLYEFLFQWVRLGNWQGDPLFLGDLLWMAISVGLLFYLPAWALDRKMEV